MSQSSMLNLGETITETESPSWAELSKLENINDESRRISNDGIYVFFFDYFTLRSIEDEHESENVMDEVVDDRQNSNA